MRSGNEEMMDSGKQKPVFHKKDRVEIFAEWQKGIEALIDIMQTSINIKQERLAKFFNSVLDVIEGKDSYDHFQLLDQSIPILKQNNLSEQNLLLAISGLRNAVIENLQRLNTTQRSQSPSNLKEILNIFDDLLAFVQKNYILNTQLESEETGLRFQSAVNHIPAGLFHIEGARFEGIPFINQHLLLLCGLSQEDLQSEDIWKRVVHPEDRKKFESEMKEAYESGQHRYRISYRLRMKSGEFIPVIEEGTIDYGNSNLPVSIQGIIIEDQPQGKEHPPVARFDDRLKLLIEIQKDLAINADRDKFYHKIIEYALLLIPAAQAGNFLRIEKDGLRFVAGCGHDIKEVKNLTLFKARSDHPVYQDFQFTLMQQGSAILELYECRDEIFDVLNDEERLALNQFGNLNSIRSILSGLLQSENKPYGFLNLVISNPENNFSEDDRLLFDIYLNQVTAIFNYLNISSPKKSPVRNNNIFMRYSSIPAFIHAKDGTRLVNDKFAEFCGFPPKEIPECSFTDVLHPEDMKIIAARFDEILKGKNREARYKFRIKNRNGNSLHCEGSFKLIKYDGAPAIFGEILEYSKTALPRKDLPVVKPVENREERAVLVVDDEADLLHITRAILEHLGYRVYAATSGNQAVEIYQKQQSEIDLVLLDYVMPDMNGKQTFDMLKRIDPNLQVLICSGYSEQEGIQDLLQEGILGVLPKPFTIKSLSQKLNQVFI